jgi:hypothetical protein
MFCDRLASQKLREPLSILIKYKTTVTPKINILIFLLSTKIQSSSGMMLGYITPIYIYIVKIK